MNDQEIAELLSVVAAMAARLHGEPSTHLRYDNLHERIRALERQRSAATPEWNVCDNCKRAAKAKDGRTEHGIPIGPCYCAVRRVP